MFSGPQPGATGDAQLRRSADEVKPVGAIAWQGNKEGAKGKWQVAEVEAKNNDFAWEVLEQVKIEGVRGRELRRQSGGFV